MREGREGGEEGVKSCWHEGGGGERGAVLSDSVS